MHTWSCANNRSGRRLLDEVLINLTIYLIRLPADQKQCHFLGIQQNELYCNQGNIIPLRLEDGFLVVVYDLNIDI